MHDSEITFYNLMKDKGYTLLYEPATFKVGSVKYTPDFYCLELDIFYEVINNRICYKDHIKQLVDFSQLYPLIKLKVVDINGDPIKPYKSKDEDYNKRLSERKKYALSDFIKLQELVLVENSHLTADEISRALWDQ